MRCPSRVFAAFMVVLMTSTLGAEEQKKGLPPVQATTEMVYVLRDGQEVRLSGHYYRSADGKVREDTGGGSVIADVQKGTLTLLNAERKEALVFTIPTPSGVTTTQRLPKLPAPYAQAEHEGHTVSKARMSDPDGTQREVWMATDLALPLFSRIESPGMFATKAFREVRAEEPDPKVFLVPEGFSVTHQTLPADPGLMPPSTAPSVKAPVR